MRTKRTPFRSAPWALIVLALATRYAPAEPRPLPRSLYVPIEFSLCEHLDNAVFYQDDQRVSGMPAARIFQFTYYPELDRMLPEAVQVRVEGAYVDDGEPFLARLAVTPDGVFTASRHRPLDAESQLKRQAGKIDKRLEEKHLRLKCKRHCARRAASSDSEGKPRSH